MWHEDFWVPRLPWLPTEEKSIWHLTSLNFSSCTPSGKPTRVLQVDLGLRNSSRLKIQIWKNSVPKKRSFLGQLSTMGSWVLGKFNGAIWMVVIPIFLMSFFRGFFEVGDQKNMEKKCHVHEVSNGEVSNGESPSNEFGPLDPQMSSTSILIRISTSLAGNSGR